MGRARVTSRIKDWGKNRLTDSDTSAFDVATAIHRDAVTLAPHDNGDLQASGRVERRGKGDYAVVFGSNEVPYARRRHYENKKNPGTKRYLENAGKANSRSFKRLMERP